MQFVLARARRDFVGLGRLKKLGQSPRIGGFATRALTVSYVMVESIFDVLALIILGGIQQECPIQLEGAGLERVWPWIIRRDLLGI